MKRPWYLTLVLILSLLGAVFSIFTFSVGSGAIQQALPNLPSWYMMALVVLSVIEFVAVVMLWMWKMIGFYLIVGITALVSVLGFVYQGSSSLGSVALGVVGLVLLYLAMRPVWQNFK